MSERDITKKEAHAVAQSQGKIREMLARAMPCEVCGGKVLTPGRTRHFMCDPDSLVGRACTCPPNCSLTAWGNGPAECDRNCVPCRINRGKSLVEKRAKGG